MDLPETNAPLAGEGSGGSRVGRRVLGAAIAGAAVSLLPQWRARVFATTPPDDTTGVTVPDQGSSPKDGAGSSDDEPSDATDVTVTPTGPTPDETDAPTTSQAATTTTAAPQRPTAGDEQLLGFAQQVEEAIVDLYDSALAVGGFEDTVRVLFLTIREAHQAAGQDGAALLGRAQSGDEPYELSGFSVDQFSGPVEAVAMAAYRLEATAMATHIDIIGQLEATDGARLLASIVTTEARNCTVLADLAGQDLDVLLLSDEEALQPAAQA